MKVSGNWLVGELTYPTSPWEIGRYAFLFFFFFLFFSFFFLLCVGDVIARHCFFLLSPPFLTPMFPFVHIVTKRFKPDLNVVHSWDLNFVLRSEIFVHYDGQLRASHLILECIPLYTSYQDPGQALTVGNPLLSYLNVHLRGFLPRGLTLVEARRLNPRQIREGSLLLVRDGSTNRVFLGRAEHILVEEPIVAIPISIADPILVEET